MRLAACLALGCFLAAVGLAGAAASAEQGTSSPVVQRYRSLALELLGEARQVLDDPRLVLPRWRHPRSEDPNNDTREPPRDTVLAELVPNYYLLGDAEQANREAAALNSSEARVTAQLGLGSAALAAGDRATAQSALSAARKDLASVPAKVAPTLRLQASQLASELGATDTSATIRAKIYPGQGPRIYRVNAPSIIPREKYKASGAEAAALAGKGETEPALQLAAKIPLAMHRARAYLDIASALVDKNDTAGALKAARLARAATEKTLGPAGQASQWSLLGGIYGRLGYRKHAAWAFARAFETIPSVPETSAISTDSGYLRLIKEQPMAFAYLAGAVAESGDLETAFHVMDRVTAPDQLSLERGGVYRLQAEGWLQLARHAKAASDTKRTQEALAKAFAAVKALRFDGADQALEVAVRAQEAGLGSLSLEAERTFMSRVQAMRKRSDGFPFQLAERRILVANAIALAAVPPPIPVVAAAVADEPEPPKGLNAVPEGTVSVGKAQTLTCLDQPLVSYQVYVPPSASAAGLRNAFLMIPPGGSANLPSAALAERLGWVMIALQKTTYDIDELYGAALSAVRDFSHRVGHPLTWRFGGLSAGGFASGQLGRTLASSCGGVVMIGSCDEVDDVRYPVVFLMGETDYNRGDAELIYGRLRAGKPYCRLMYHPGGHTLGRPEDLKNALLYLKASFRGR